jgi:hypothetical protein
MHLCYSLSYANELGMSCVGDGDVLCLIRIEVHSQLRIHPKGSFTSGDKLEMSCTQPSQLSKNLASGL